MSGQVLAVMGMPMKGFCDEADIVAEAMAFTSTAAQGAPAEAPIPPPKLVPIEESTQTEKVGEFVPIPAKIPTPQKEVTPTGASQTGSASPITPPVISTNDPFIALSQAVKNGSSLVVTPSSIPNSTTQWLDADLSSNEGFKEVLEDSKDELVIRVRVYESDEDGGGEQETEAIGMCLLSLANLLFPFFLSLPNTIL